MCFGWLLDTSLVLGNTQHMLERLHILACLGKPWDPTKRAGGRVQGWMDECMNGWVDGWKKTALCWLLFIWEMYYAMFSASMITIQTIHSGWSPFSRQNCLNSVWYKFSYQLSCHLPHQHPTTRFFPRELPFTEHFSLFGLFSVNPGDGYVWKGQ